MIFECIYWFLKHNLFLRTKPDSHLPTDIWVITCQKSQQVDVKKRVHDEIGKNIRYLDGFFSPIFSIDFLVTLVPYFYKSVMKN